MRLGPAAQGNSASSRAMHLESCMNRNWSMESVSPTAVEHHNRGKHEAFLAATGFR